MTHEMNPIPEEPEDYKEYKRQAIEESKREAEENNPIRQRLQLKSFVSRSSGRGRRKRKPREVNLLVVDGEYAHVIKHGEIKPRKNGRYIQVDALAEEILSPFLPKEDRTPENLLKLLNRFG